MEKAKNILLVIGVILNLNYVVMQLFKFVYHCVTVLPQSESSITYFIFTDLLPALILVALTVLPVILLILNLKNKSTKVLPIISAVLCGLFGLFELFGSVTPAIPKYLIYSELNIVNTHWVYVLGSLQIGGILLFAGFTLLTVGSIMSLIKSKE